MLSILRQIFSRSDNGRIKFGETAEEVVVREVFEETGMKMEIDRLGFVHENYFYGDTATNMGKLIYEISFCHCFSISMRRCSHGFSPVIISLRSR